MSDNSLVKTIRALHGESLGSLSRKASGEIVYNAPWTRQRKPFTMPALKPRVDKGSKTAERIKADIEVSENCERFTGRTCQGFHVAATDGHRALMLPGIGPGEKLDYIGVVKGSTSHVIDDPEFYLALKRALVIADERSHSVYLVCRDSILTIRASHSDLGDFEETLPIKSTADFQIAFSGDYLEPMLGVWPLRLWVKDQDTAAVFEPLDGSWRYLLMPMRAEWDWLKKQDSKSLVEVA